MIFIILSKFNIQTVVHLFLNLSRFSFHQSKTDMYKEHYIIFLKLFVNPKLIYQHLRKNVILKIYFEYLTYFSNLLSLFCNH
jgi:hypothetical protein